jgi:V8-like Glu-specific endopeptidase
LLTCFVDIVSAKKTIDDESEREQKNNDDGQQERDSTRVRCSAVGQRELRMPTV